MARHLAPFSWRQRMAEMVRRRSFGCVLPLGRHSSTNGSKFVHCASDTIALSSFQKEQNARHPKQFKGEQALAHDERNTQLATVNDALAVLRSERFDAYRYTKAGNERPAWTDAVEALTTAQTTMTLEATALARSATVRLLAFAARFLDRPAEQ